MWLLIGILLAIGVVLTLGLVAVAVIIILLQDNLEIWEEIERNNQNYNQQ